MQLSALQGADGAAAVMRRTRIWERCKGWRVALALQVSRDAQSQGKAASSSHAQDRWGLNRFASWTLSSEHGFSSSALPSPLIFPAKAAG